MKRLTFIPAILIMLVSAYELAANFAKYKTYQWADLPDGAFSDQLIDQAIKRAVDEQLDQKGLVRVEKHADLQIGYQAVIIQDKTIAFMGTESLRWGWADGFMQGETSNISVGMLWIDLYDPARKHLVWRGDASKAIDLRKAPEKNYKKLRKAMENVFRKLGYLFDSSCPNMLWLSLVPRTSNDAFVGFRCDSNSLLKQAIEHLAPRT